MMVQRQIGSCSHGSASFSMEMGMGRYDDITAAQLRADLVRFAQLILRLEEEDGLLVSPADLQTLLGELRRKLFAWEVRCSQRLGSRSGDEESGREDDADARASDASLRIVKDALEREAELRRKWSSESGGASDSNGD
ncbi:MAG: hypothetical protein EA352_09470 [Gemmatimonadales bacterium]|nr:MAG: hypothetical protein EA352_09470 [Gemmatimonadales bacterium]